MKKATTYTSADVTAASVIGLGVIGLVSALFASSGLAPMFAIPLTAALAGAVVSRAMDYRAGKRSINDLAKIGKQYVSLAIGAAIFGFVMPMLFPNGAYNYAKWLVLLNSVFLVAGLTAIPIAKGINIAVAWSADRRARGEGGN